MLFRLSEVKERRRELHTACAALKGASAAAMAEAVEEACPAAIRRRERGTGPLAPPPDVRVDIDAIDDANAAVLLETARGLAAGVVPGGSSGP